MDPATMAALFSAGGSILGGLGAGGGREKIQAMEAIPRALRGDYLGLAGQVNDLQTPEYYQGQLVADQNPWLSGALGGMGGWGSGMGGDMMNAMYGGGMAGLGAMGSGMDYLNSLAGGGGFQFDQGLYDDVMSKLAPGMQGAFDSGALNMQRGFDWDVLPGLNMSGALGGQQGSTKQYQQGALGQALADKNIADFGLGLWNNATGQALDAGMRGGLYDMQNQQNILNSYGQFAGLGNNMMNQAYNMGVGNLGMGFDAGQYQLGYDQSLIDAEMDRWNYNQQAPWTALSTQLGMLPGPGGVQPSVAGMSPFEGMMQGAMAGAGLYGAGQDMGWWGVPPSTGGYKYNDPWSAAVGYGEDQGWF